MKRHTWKHTSDPTCGKHISKHCRYCGACPGKPHENFCRIVGRHRKA